MLILSQKTQMKIRAICIKYIENVFQKKFNYLSFELKDLLESLYISFVK